MTEPLWCLKVVAEKEFEERLSETIKKSGEPAYEEWSVHKEDLRKFLGHYGDGEFSIDLSCDFLIDDDWYGERYFSVCFLSKDIYRKDIFFEMQNFIRMHMPKYSIVTVGNFPVMPIIFCILITNKLSIMTFREGREVYVRKAAVESDRREEIHDWLRILDGLAISAY